MKYEPENNQFLDDVLLESAESFREQLLGDTLRRVRRRRRWRQTRRGATILAMLGLLGIFVWKNNSHWSHPASSVATRVERNFKLVETESLPANAVVSTQPLATGQLASISPVRIIETESGGYNAMNDDELFALLASHPALLVRAGPHSGRLIFANPKDEKGFPLN